MTGAPAVIAKASEGTTFVDTWYNNFKSQAASLGIPFAAYHWLHRGNPVGEARHAFSVVGSKVPLMVDDETPEAGFSMETTLAFVAEYRRLGGLVTMEYLPRWYWQGSGSPNLTPLSAAGLALVSSNYASTGYSDTGPGWAAYGGVTPSIWQYTSSQQFNGQRVDFNGFRGGGVPELAALFANGTRKVTDMQQYFFGRDASTNTYWLCDGMYARGPLTRPASSGDKPTGRDEIADIKALAAEGMFSLWRNGEIREGMVSAFGLKVPWPSAGGGPGCSVADLAAAVRAELDKTAISAVPGKLGPL